MKVQLYQIVREHRYNGGHGFDGFVRNEHLYTGYDRLEAIRVFHESLVSDSANRAPGTYYHMTKAKGRKVRTEASP